MKNKTQENFSFIKALIKIDFHNWEMMSGKHNYHDKHKQA